MGVEQLLHMYAYCSNFQCWPLQTLFIIIDGFAKRVDETGVTWAWEDIRLLKQSQKSSDSMSASRESNCVLDGGFKNWGNRRAEQTCVIETEELLCI